MLFQVVGDLEQVSSRIRRQPNLTVGRAVSANHQKAGHVGQPYRAANKRLAGGSKIRFLAVPDTESDYVTHAGDVGDRRGDQFTIRRPCRAGEKDWRKGLRPPTLGKNLFT